MSVMRNAVIMAAGMSRRFVPLAYEIPKGLLVVKGEVLIERQIRQLRAAGVYDITVIAGYMADKFSYLKEKYGIRIVVNEDYYRYNNTSSLMCVLDRLADTYICSSDNYFAENVFMEQCSYSYYAACYSAGETLEWCMTLDRSDRIQGIRIGGRASWFMLGHVFVTAEFSTRFREILIDEYACQQTRKELWESVYIRHIDELELCAKKYNRGVIWEFDSLDELREFDGAYINQSGSAVIRMLAEQMGCREGELTGFAPVGNNPECYDFSFFCRSDKYVYLYEKKEVKRLQGES